MKMRLFMTIDRSLYNKRQYGSD